MAYKKATRKTGDIGKCIVNAPSVRKAIEAARKACEKKIETGKKKKPVKPKTKKKTKRTSKK